MAQQSTPPIAQNKSYGDTKRLEELATGLKSDNAAPLPTERRPVGRPEGTPQPTAVQPVAQPAIPQEHIQLFQDFSRAARVAQVATAAAQDPMAGPWLRQYAEIAQRRALAKAEEVRAMTPFFDEE